MPTENKPAIPSLQRAPSLSDTQARDSFIAAALAQIVAVQMSDNKVNHDMAGALAVRYANSAMAFRASETASLNLVVKKGTAVAIPPPPPVTVPDVQPPPVMAVREEPPKSIAEIIGEPAEQLEEVK